MLGTVNFTTSVDHLSYNISSYSDHFTALPNLNYTEEFKFDRSKLNVPYTVIESLVAIVAVIGNGLVIIAFSREKKLRKRTNFYIISLAFADFLVGILGIPFAVLVS